MEFVSILVFVYYILGVGVYNMVNTYIRPEDVRTFTRFLVYIHSWPILILLFSTGAIK